MRVYATRAKGAKGGFDICFDVENPRQALLALVSQMDSLGIRLDRDWVSEFTARHRSEGLPLWVNAASDGTVSITAAPDQDALLEMPWGIILGGNDADTVRHQLFEDDAAVTVPDKFNTITDYEVWIDEAARRAHGFEPLSDVVQQNEVLAQRIKTAIEGISDEQTRNDALKSRLFGEGAQSTPAVEDPSGRGGGSQADRREGGAAGERNASGEARPDAGAGDREGGSGRSGGVHRADDDAGNGAVGDNFVINGLLGTIKGDKSRAAANIAAIECMVQLGADAATPEQQEVLAEYVGWGGLPNIFDETKDEWSSEREQLKALTSEQEYDNMRASTLNAHYTSVPVVKALWSALEAAGYDGGGDILEPACGIGHFIGAGPPNANVTGIELDPFTARIATKLYPQANIQNVGFENADLGHEGEFDVAVGNPPFGTDRLYDANHRDLSHHSIHNYFLAKSLRGVKPGGMAAFVVSRFFLDAGNDKTRQMIHQMADLVGAVRLPDTAFARNAGSSVVTDLVVFRKRLPHEQVPDLAQTTWLHADKHWDEKAEASHNLNRFITQNPNFVVGEPSWDGGMFRGSCYTVKSNIEVDDQDGVGAEAARRLVYQVQGKQREHGTEPLYQPQDDPERQQKQAGIPSVVDLDMTDVQRKMGGMIVHTDGEIYVVKANPNTLRMNLVEKHQPKNAQDEKRLRALLQIRDKTRELLVQESNPKCDVIALRMTRDSLREDVEQFIKVFGGVYNGNRNSSLLRDEPDRHLVMSLHDSETGTHAALLERRVNNPVLAHVTPQSVPDALALSYSERGVLDVEYMADLLATESVEVEQQLLDLNLAYRNPVDGTLENVDDYLSGNVRRKLREAEAAARDNPAYESNVRGLEQTVPADIPAEDIFVQIQSPWLPADVLSDFMREHCGMDVDCVRYGTDSALKADRAHQQRTNPQLFRNRNNVIFGTGRMNAIRILQRVANGQEVVVYDRVMIDGKERQVANAEETALAQIKADELQSAFKQWVWTDSERATRLEQHYNETMNSHVLRRYDGSFLRFRGMATAEINLRKNQRDAAWRMVCQERTLVDHAVGAGKTFTAFAAEIEKQNMGLINKSMFVVPNHLVGQWAQEAQRLYPGVAVLTMEPGTFTKGKRREFLARVATGDWQAIICPHSVFGLIETSRDWQLEMLYEEQRNLDKTVQDILSLQQADRAAGNDNSAVGRLSVKSIERKRKSVQRKIAELQSKPNVDHLLSWEQLGIDSLVVDEAQEFKNLRYETSYRNLGGLGPAKGSKKAWDLYSKIRWMDKKEGRTTVTFLSGTPISNTVAEAYHLMSYLAPQALDERRCGSLDVWLRTFAEINSDYEVNVTGMGFKKKNRVRSFHNLPELCVMYGGFADVITNDDLDREHLKETGEHWPIPRLVGDAPEKHISDKSPYLVEVFNDIVERMRRIEKREVAVEEDNVLKCLHDARTNALDARIQATKEVPYDDQSKVEVVAREIIRIHDSTDDVKGVQLVFCDLSTPKQFRKEETQEIEALSRQAEQGDAKAVDALEQMRRRGTESDFDVYNELRKRVVELSGGRISVDEFAFIHEAGMSLNKRNALFERTRKGDVRILMGSTGKMGTGMNVQERLVALHHMDVPWRPADLEQREGRILRQGNELLANDPNFRVEIHRYGTQATSDAKSWDTLQRKATFISKFRKGNMGASDREMEDISETVHSYAEMKALTSDNPLILVELELNGAKRTLEREARSHAAQKRRFAEIATSLADHDIKSKREVADNKRFLKAYNESDHTLVTPTGTEITLPSEKEGDETDKEFNTRRSALRSQVMRAFSSAYADQVSSQSYTPDPTVLTYKGFSVIFQASGAPMQSASAALRTVTVKIETPKGKPVHSISYHSGTMSSFSPQGFMARFDNIFREDVPRRIQHSLDERPKNEAALIEARERQHEEFPKQKELEKTTNSLNDVRRRLMEAAQEQDKHPAKERAAA